MKSINLTKRERQIMNIFWNAKTLLSVNDVAQQQKDLSKNSIQAVVRKLKNYELIRVGDIGYSGTVLTRLYEPNVPQEEFLANEVSDDSFLKMMTNFIETTQDTEVLSQLADSIKIRQEEL